MKKLWAAVLTGLLGWSTVSLAADPVPASTLVPIPPPPALQTTTAPVSPYSALPTLPPPAATPTTADPIVVKKKSAFAVPTTAPTVKPGETKWTDVKALPVQMPPAGTTDAKPLLKDAKPGDLKSSTAPVVTPVPAGAVYVRPPGSWKPGPVAPSCTPCPVVTRCTPCPKPCTTTVTVVPCPKPCPPVVAPCPKPCVVAAPAPCAKPCATCNSGCGASIGGKLRDWFTYRPCPTPLGECAGAYRQPPVYTFFLDTPCRETWKPVACCEKPCGTCGTCKTGCAPGCSTAAVVPLPVPLPEPVPAPSPATARPLPNR